MAQNILKTYSNIFRDFEKSKIPYFVYKGLEKLEKNLYGNGGDIDIYVDKKHIGKARKILLDHKLKDVSNTLYKNTFFGIDEDSGVSILIDINTDIHIFRKPFFYHIGKIKIDISQIQIEKNSLGIQVLGRSDYLGLMLLIRSTAKTINKKKIIPLTEELEKGKVDTSTYFWKLIKKIFGEDTDTIIKNYQRDCISKENRNILLKYHQTPKNAIKEKLIQFRKFIRAMFIKIGFPPYKIRKRGFIVAFTGVDGSGKSSAVDMLSENNFFKYTGIKKIYFGNNNYWIPGLTFLLKKTKNFPGRLILSIFVKIDRQLRIIGALYYIWLGNIVIADRYYYDDMVAKNPYLKKTLQYYLYTIYMNVFKVRMFKIPEISFYMDVSPEEAYKRKQDYDFETMKRVNTLYATLMKSRDEVTIIDANKPMDEVHREIISIVYNYK